MSAIIKGFYCDADDAYDYDYSDDEVKDDDAAGKKRGSGSKPSLVAMIEGFIWEPICPHFNQRRRRAL